MLGGAALTVLPKVVQNYARSSLVGVLSRYSLLPLLRLRSLLRRVEGNVGGVSPFLNKGSRTD